MIFEWFIGFVLDVVTEVVGLLLPDFTTAIPDFSGALGTMLTMNQFLPLTETLGAALVVMTVQSGMFLIKLFQVVLAHLPGVGGAGA